MHLRAFAHLLLIVSSTAPSLSSSDLSEGQKEMDGWKDNLNEATGKRGMELLVERIAKVHQYCSDHELTPPERLLALEKIIRDYTAGASPLFSEFLAVRRAFSSLIHYLGCLVRTA